MTFFFQSVVWRQKRPLEVKRPLSSWKASSFKTLQFGSHKAHILSLENGSMEAQNALLCTLWKKAKGYNFPFTGSNVIVWIEERIWRKWGRRGQCFKNTAIKHTAAAWLQSASSVFFQKIVLNLLKSFSSKCRRWQTFLVFSYTVKASSKMLLNLHYRQFIIEEFHFHDSNYFVKLRCQIFSNGQSVILEVKSIYIYLCCSCKSSLLGPPRGVTWIDTLKIKTHVTYCACVGICKFERVLFL